ncbi:MAG: aldo/keto reductase [Thermodesulfobacteriota bacterium]|nr:aldo/keto reductase [Thermodesulfobacteriota bacterium]
MEQRSFGKTDQRFPILSFGAQRIVDSHGCTEEEAITLINYALDRGIRYFDTAWIYSEGQSEKRLGKVARHRRKEMWIATKVLARSYDEAWKQIEESLQRLQTDYVDELRMHNIWSFEELDKVTASGGALETAIHARDKGLVHYISISGHTNPQVQIEALRRFPFDSVLCAVSVLDHFIMSFAHEFLPVAHCEGVAVIGMKVMGLGKLAQIYDKALRYTLSLPICTAVVGVETLQQLERNIEVAENYYPLSDSEQLELFKEVLPMVTPETVPWKVEDWNNPIEWAKR